MKKALMVLMLFLLIPAHRKRGRSKNRAAGRNRRDSHQDRPGNQGGPHQHRRDHRRRHPTHPAHRCHGASSPCPGPGPKQHGRRGNHVLRKLQRPQPLLQRHASDDRRRGGERTHQLHHRAEHSLEQHRTNRNHQIPRLGALRAVRRGRNRQRDHQEALQTRGRPGIRALRELRKKGGRSQHARSFARRRLLQHQLLVAGHRGIPGPDLPQTEPAHARVRILQRHRRRRLFPQRDQDRKRFSRRLASGRLRQGTPKRRCSSTGRENPSRPISA